jgi:Ni/Co efflux regulator RcnB
MIRRLAWTIVVAAFLAAPAVLAQTAPAAVKAKKPPIAHEPWPDDDVLLARRTDAEQRKLFQDGPPLEFTLTADFGLINRQRTPNNAKPFPGVLTAGASRIPVTLSSRGHLRLKTETCDFVPIRVDFQKDALAGTIFESQGALKLGTHCRNEPAADQYVIREYLAYKLANLVTPFSFRARLARATYVDAASNRPLSTHHALFLEHENDVARRLGGREVRVEHMVFNDFDREALTTTMMLEYMLGNTDYSIWSLHNVVIVADKRRRFYPVPYDFDLSGMVNPTYAAPDPRLSLKSVTDRLYRGPCRTVEEFDAAAEPFRAHKGEMMAGIESVAGLDRAHKTEMQDYLESFFRRIATRQAIKRTFVDGCPASRSRI